VARVGAPVVLALFQGWGDRPERLGNVIAEAETPNFDQLWEAYPHTLLETCGAAVGLTPGMVGSAAAGYAAIAAGRPVTQAAACLDAAIADGSFFTNPVLIELARQVRDEGRRLHLLGLISDGQVVSRERHYLALLALLAKAGVPGRQVLVHAVLDGYDTPARSGMNYLARLAAEMRRTAIGRVATLMGRAYGLLPLGGWEACERAYGALVHGAGRLAASAIEAVQAGYSRGEDDLTLSPAVVLGPDGLPLGRLADGDLLLCFNHREEGLERLLTALLAPAEPPFDRGKRPELRVTTLAEYGLAKPFGVTVAWPAEPSPPSLGQVATVAGRRLALVAEAVVADRQQLLGRGAALDPALCLALPSPPLEHMVDHPQRLTTAITAQVTAWLEAGAADLIVADYFNVDLAGHLGQPETARLAVEALDATLAPLVRAARRAGATVLLSGCFGNVEDLALANTARPNPAHSLNPVPLLLINDTLKGLALPESGEHGLADLGVTLAAILGVELPRATGCDLLAQLAPLAAPRPSEEGPAALEISAAEALAMMIAAGRDAARWYQAAAGCAADPEVGLVYGALGRDEERRTQALERRHELLAGSPAPAPRRDGPRGAAAPDPRATALGALDRAVAEEWQTYRLLCELAARNLDPHGTAVLEQLANEELEVFQRLQRLSESEAIRLLALGTG